MGFPIRRFPDQSLFAAPRDLSQRTTSFIASQRQGIHRTPLWHLIALIANARRPVRSSPLPGVSSRDRPQAAPVRLGSLRIRLGQEDGLALDFRKDQFCFKRIRELKRSAQAHDCNSDLRSPRETPSLAASPSRSDRPTECVSSSRCQIIAPSPAQRAASKRNSFVHRRKSAVGNRRGHPAPYPGGARRDRTDDLMLAKHALSQLSYGPRRQSAVGKSAVGSRSAAHDCRLPIPDCRSWWAWEDLNLRPHAYQARALTN